MSLTVVATPIGNRGDLSSRAIGALCKASIVLAEDTRVTRPLLTHVGSTARLLSCHQHNELGRIDAVDQWLREGTAVALVSDAGAPGISDPGGRLVAELVARGHTVEVIPGPSAVIAALMGAGLAAPRFSFLGFLPRRGVERERLIRRAQAVGGAVVLFEAANRVTALLDDLFRWLGPKPVVVARELTKRFETFHRGALPGPLAPPFKERGEVVVVVELGEGSTPEAPAALTAADAEQSPRARAKIVARSLGIPVRDAYRHLVEGTLPALPGPVPEPTAAAPDGDSRPTSDPMAVSANESAPVGALYDVHRAVRAAARALLALERAFQSTDSDDDNEAEGIDLDPTAALAALAITPRPATPAPVELRETVRHILGALESSERLVEACDDDFRAPRVNDDSAAP